MLYEGFGYYCSPGNKVITPTWGSLKEIHPREVQVFLRHSFRDSVGRCISPSLQLVIWCCHPTQQWPFKNVLTLKVVSLWPRETVNCVSRESQCFSGRNRGKHRDKTVHSPLFFRKIVEIEQFASRAAILDECQKSSFDTHPRWLPVTQSARSRRYYGKMGGCEQSTSRFEGNKINCFPKDQPLGDLL